MGANGFSQFILRNFFPNGAEMRTLPPNGAEMRTLPQKWGERFCVLAFCGASYKRVRRCILKKCGGFLFISGLRFYGSQQMVDGVKYVYLLVILKDSNIVQVLPRLVPIVIINELHPIPPNGAEMRTLPQKWCEGFVRWLSLPKLVLMLTINEAHTIFLPRLVLMVTINEAHPIPHLPRLGFQPADAI